jgi:hypothetical protein
MTSVPAASLSRTYGPFLLLVAWIVAIKLVIVGGSPAFRSPAQAAVFAWPFLGAVLAAAARRARSGSPGCSARPSSR